MKMLI